MLDLEGLGFVTYGTINMYIQSNLVKRERIKRYFALSGTHSFAS
jgi:hypothetical protein